MFKKTVCFDNHTKHLDTVCVRNLQKFYGYVCVITRALYSQCRYVNATGHLSALSVLSRIGFKACKQTSTVQPQSEAAALNLLRDDAVPDRSTKCYSQRFNLMLFAITKNAIRDQRCRLQFH